MRVSLTSRFPDKTKPVPSEHTAEVKFEIGHVLFIDIVGYSKLMINEQSEQIRTLKQSHAKENSFAWPFNWLPLP
ncbi:MAG TPA: hypothetical protein VGI59_11105 [Candidatus Udaeobacter sp.]|jgi:hypothetical protein